MSDRARPQRSRNSESSSEDNCKLNSGANASMSHGKHERSWSHRRMNSSEASAINSYGRPERSSYRRLEFESIL